MPIVHTKKKNNAGKEVRCGKCGDKIVPGTQYLTWSFRYAGTRFRCVKPNCRPRGSELTTAKIGQVYELNERLEDACSALRDSSDFDSFRNECESIRDDANSLAEEFNDSRSNMPDQLQDSETGELLGSRAEALEEFANELDSAIDNAEWPDENEPEIADECEHVDCGMAEDDDRHKKGHADFDHEFEAPDSDGNETDPETVVSDFESISCDCD